MLKAFSNVFWIFIPEYFQKQISRIFASFLELRASKFFILPYCFLLGLDGGYLDQFESETERSFYSSYSDFFERKFKALPNLESSEVWPCEGYVCDMGTFSDRKRSVVKGQTLDLNMIFKSHPSRTENYFFTNIFLHNHNYHRIHSPINGVITKINFIPGELNFLRPWLYRKADISYPAFKNERVVFEIMDESRKIWYLAMVGGFGVGTIKVYENIFMGTKVGVGQEIARFKLGSTVCLATPHHLKIEQYLNTVRVGEALKITERG